MKIKILILFFCGMSSFAQDQKVPEMRIEGFSHPESVVYDAAREQYYVSNIGDKEEGDGFISIVSKNDKIEQLLWITGLNDPKGLVIHGNKLYVTDVTAIVAMDIETGKILSRIPVEGAQSLNDPAKDEAGNIYFSDLAKGSIYILRSNGQVEEWLSSPELQRPNGLLITDDSILVSAWGQEDPGQFLRVDRSTKEVESISNEGIGKLDGVQKIEEGEYYISDWGSGSIYKISMDGTFEKVLTTAKSSGDILYRNDVKKLYVPMNHQNEVWIYKMN